MNPIDIGNNNVDITKELPTVLSLCSGYGGIERGLDLAGFKHRVIAFSEIEAFAIANLVNKMEANLISPAPVYTNLKTLPVECFRDRVDLITGGYPCQPFSAAGQRKGTDDPRHLWPYIKEIIRAVRPVRCFFENVEGHISLGLREVISDLESLGYKTAWGIFSAREVGAPHQRKRVYIMGNAQHDGSSDCEKPRDIDKTISNCTQGQDQAVKSERASRPSGDADLSRGVADSDSVRCDWWKLPDTASQRPVEIEAQQRSRQPVVRSEAEGCGGDGGENVADSKGKQNNIRKPRNMAETSSRGKCGNATVDFGGSNGDSRFSTVADSGGERRIDASWPPEPGLGRVVDGCADRVDRIRLLGNGIVPQTAAKAWITLQQEIEDSTLA